MSSDGTLRLRAFALISTCFAERIASAITSSRASPEALKHGDRLVIAPMALGRAGRERVTGHDIAAFQRALRLIMQRGAYVLDRIDEVQPVSERLQVGFLRGQRGRRHRELGEIEERGCMRRADRFCWTEAAPRAPLKARRV
jgi:hypothetical protein